MNARIVLGALLLVHCAASPSVFAASWLTFSEISYRPHGDPELEFVEIYNLDAPGVELGGWKLEGEVSFEFTRGTRLGPRACLVVARDLAAFRERYPGVENVVGPFRGNLADAGGGLRLRNRVGATAARMRYGRDGAWPTSADGTGHTLVLEDAFFDARVAESWIASREVGGSPGVFETTFRRVPGEPVLSAGAEWRFFRGVEAPPADWFAPSFDDSAWESGASGFGFGDGDDRTELADMAGRYLGVFTRTSFRIDDVTRLGELTLLVDFDDGFVAFLNGTEVARANVGRPGDEVSWDRPATGSREAGRAQEFPLGLATQRLRAGENVLAVAGFNNDLRSSDLSLIVELESKVVEEAAKLASTAASRVRINEVSTRRTEGGRQLEWIELHQSGGAEVDLGGAFLSDDPAELEKWSIPPGTKLGADGFLVLSRKEIGQSGALGEALYLSGAPAGPDAGVIDALSLRSAITVESGLETVEGRFPDGARTCDVLALGTPGAANRRLAPSDLVISEIHYHPPGDDPAGEFIEIHNRGAERARLAGLRLDGALRYEFAADAELSAGGFIVVAKDPTTLARKRGLPTELVFGPFDGRLGNGGETIRLSDARGRAIDIVEYADRAPWPWQADGWGASLELRDARVDNALAGAWTASDEASRSSWQKIEYRGGAYVFPDMSPSSFQFLLLDAGECLIDDIRIVDEDGKPVIEDGFDSATTTWRAFGTHGGSRVEARGSDPANRCYRIVATGRGNSRHNYVSLDLNPELRKNAKYTVSFRARWLTGCARLLSRTSGQGLAKAHRLRVPDSGGTPARSNSRRERSSPVVGVPTQEPVCPSSSQATRLVVEISGASEIVHAQLRYRHESDAKWSSTRLHRMASSRWSASIPPQATGRVEFAVVARDRDGREGAFPPQGIARPAQFAVDLAVEPSLPTYAVLVTEKEWAMSRQRERMSNQVMDATLVFGRSRIFYNVGLRARGSGFTRGSRNWRLVFGARSLGEHSQLTFDGQGRDLAKANERTVFWLLDQVDVPTPRQRYVHVTLYGHPEESGIYEDVEKVDGDFLARWFPRPDSGVALPGRLHKVDDYWDFRPPAIRDGGEGDLGFGGERRFGGFRGFGSRGGSYVEAYLQYETEDPEDYRWNFPPRANGQDEDFAPLIELIRTADPAKTKDAEFLERAEKLIDVGEWASVIAARTLANDWDSYGLNRGKNAYLYRAPSGRWQLLPWDSDLSWQGRGGFGGFGGFGRFGAEERAAPIVSSKFPAIRRLFSPSKYLRLLSSDLAFLATKRLDAKTFERVVGEIGEVVGVEARQLLATAASQRQRFLAALPSADLAVASVEIVRREGHPDLVRVAGTTPMLAHELRLGGTSGTVEYSDDTTFRAEFELDAPPGGKLRLEALDRDGDSVGHLDVQVTP